MLRKICCLMLCAVFIAVSGCGLREDIKVNIKGNKTVGVWKGQVLELRLDANAATGYLWEEADSVNKGIVEQIGKFKYIHKSRMIGAPGVQVYRCEGIKKGKARLVFEYRRPWEKEKKPAKRYVVTIRVN